MKSLICMLAAPFLAKSLTYYDPPSNRLSVWRQDCSCVGDISSWQDGQ